MRKLILLLAILALPGLAMAEHLDVVSGGAPAILVDPMVSTGPIVIDILLTTAIPLDGAQYSLSADLNGGGPGTGDGLVSYDAATPWVHALGPTGFTGLGGDYVQLIGVGAIPPGSTFAAVNTMGPELYFKSFGQTPLLNNALLCSYTIHLTGPVSLGDQIVIMAGADPGPGPNGMFGNGYISGTAGGPWHPGAPLVIDIVPEPATMLLLLGALPFLRRRR